MNTFKVGDTQYTINQFAQPVEDWFFITTGTAKVETIQENGQDSWKLTGTGKWVLFITKPGEYSIPDELRVAINTVKDGSQQFGKTFKSGTVTLTDSSLSLTATTHDNKSVVIQYGS